MIQRYSEERERASKKERKITKGEGMSPVSSVPEEVSLRSNVVTP